jgi:hypothetical protein
VTNDERKALRQAVADYMYSEGCTCCQNVDAHHQHRERLAKLLGVQRRDGWYDFSKFRSSSTTAPRK